MRVLVLVVLYQKSIAVANVDVFAASDGCVEGRSQTEPVAFETVVE